MVVVMMVMVGISRIGLGACSSCVVVMVMLSRGGHVDAAQQGPASSSDWQTSPPLSPPRPPTPRWITA